MRSLIVAMFFALGASVSLSACAPANGGGSVVGNGMSHYQNANIGISIEYPAEWKLTENSSRTAVELDNSNSVKKREAASRIEFSLEPTLEGKRITSIDALSAELKARWPSRAWNAVEFAGGQRGFFARELAEGRESASYYLLDQNRNILRVSYDAASDLAGAGVVKKIVGALTIDFEPPVLERISFDPSLAKGGDTVRVIVEGWDVVGEITEVRAQVSIMGVDQSELKALPISPFVGEGGNRFVATIKIPAYAPRGQALATKVSLQDAKGNTFSAIAVDESHHRYYPSDDPEGYYYQVNGPGSKISPKQMPLKKVFLPLAENPAGQEDRAVPELLNAWFEKSLLTEQSFEQTLFLEIRDLSTVRDGVSVFFDGVSCIGPQNPKPQFMRKVGENLYAYQVDASRCFAHCPPEWTTGTCLTRSGKTWNFSLGGLEITDEVGNTARIRPEKIGFMMYR